MQRTIARILLQIFVMMATACSSPPHSSVNGPDLSAVPPPTPLSSHLESSLPEPDALAFTSNRDRNFEIYIMRDNGSHLLRLTDEPGDDMLPTWSPDGYQIAYVLDMSLFGQATNILILDLITKKQTTLTDDQADDTMPAWSPDGSTIAFVSNRDGNSELYLMQIDGSNVRRLTTTPEPDIMPAWSPDGTQLAYVSGPVDTATILIMDLESKHIFPFTNGSASAITPSWSPDGKTIAFAMRSEERDFDIYVQSVDGSAPTRLTSNNVDDVSPSWSPDGKQIAFASGTLGKYNIFIMDKDGSSVMQLTENPGTNTTPVWLPQSRSIEVIYTTWSASEAPIEARKDVRYVVQEDASLQDLVDYYDVSAAEITQFNQLEPQSTLIPGQTITIPNVLCFDPSSGRYLL